MFALYYGLPAELPVAQQWQGAALLAGASAFTANAATFDFKPAALLAGASAFTASAYQRTLGPGFVADAVLDGGLAVIDTAATAIHVLSATPSVFADVASFTLGNMTWAAGGAFGSPATDPQGGRQIASTAFSSGSQTGAGSATDWAVVDGSRLLASGKLFETVTMAGSGTFEMPSFNITLPVT